jgi:hypothetical protein
MKTSFEKFVLLTHIPLLVLLPTFRFLGGFDYNELLFLFLFLPFHLVLLFFLNKQPLRYAQLYMASVFLLILLKSLLGFIGFELMLGIWASEILLLLFYLKIKEQKFDTELPKVLSLEQVTEVLNEIDNYDLDKAFDLLDQWGINTPECNKFKQTLIWGRNDEEYFTRLKVWVKSLQAK